MPRTVEDYCDTYIIRQGSFGTPAVADPVRRGNQVVISRDAHAPEGASAWVYFYDGANLNADADPVKSLLCDMQDDGSLQGGDEGRVYRLSLYRNDGNYKALYGLILQGDPDEVGAWGADNNPP